MKYEYTPLSCLPGSSDGVFSVRLLHVLPTASHNAKLECELIETYIPDSNHGRFHPNKFTGSSHVPYQALSYTWGEPKFPYSLHVLDRGDDDTTALITPARITNITEKPDETLVLWVDAVCIDQTNISERNSQVGNIPQIYAGAFSVLVWLGIDDVHFSGRLSTAKGKPAARSASWRKRFKINQIVSAFLGIRPPRPIALLLSRPWFKRRWIIQEVVLAKDVSVHCGWASIPWSMFQTDLTELYENDMGGFSYEHRTVLRTMSHIRNANSGAKSQFPLDTLVEFEMFLCADPRDRLYALYGVMKKWFPGSADKNVQTGTVDYALPIRDVFTNFAILMMELVDTLPSGTTYQPVTHLLQLATAIQQSTSRREHRLVVPDVESIPSWVPDLTGILAYTPLNHSPPNRDASLGIPKRKVEVRTSSHNTRLLVSIGLVYDIVTETNFLDINALSGPVHTAKAALNEFLCSVAKYLDDTDFFGNTDKDEYRPTGEHIISALATTLVANWEHTPANSYFSQHHRFRNDFLEQLGASQYHLPEILHRWPAYVELVAITMRGRCLFVTDSGYIGVCSSNVQAGDVVCILSGVRVPFILRPQGAAALPVQDGFPYIPGCYPFNEEHFGKIPTTEGRGSPPPCTFQLMSDAYIEGLMNGEAAERLGGQFNEAVKTLLIE
ncbi:HET-domain-containing protein [Hypoxylon argillaceum]|nr:HET-domain-containing protein [Hypoxylon argillaceum]